MKDHPRRRVSLKTDRDQPAAGPLPRGTEGPAGRFDRGKLAGRSVGRSVRRGLKSQARDTSTGPGAGDSSSGGGAGAGIPGGGTNMRTGGSIKSGDIERDRRKLFPDLANAQEKARNKREPE